MGLGARPDEPPCIDADPPPRGSAAARAATERTRNCPALPNAGGLYRSHPDAGPAPGQEGTVMTLVWFVVWLIANNIGDEEPLIFDPVNIWAGFLILAIALDLSAAHATSGARRR